MTFDLPLAIGGLLVGTVVGLTGMGGGALMTPMLVFLFGVDPLTAISSDIVVSLFMKPVGAWVHLRRGTVNLKLVAWLCVGSVPAAFSGAWLISQCPPTSTSICEAQACLGLALMLATIGLISRALIQMWSRQLPLGEGIGVPEKPAVVLKPIRTVLLRVGCRFMVGLTSVGAGSIIVVGLLMMHPALQASALVGTDLVQAIPLVGSAAAGHMLFGSFSFAVAFSLLFGAIPGAWSGAEVSTRAPAASSGACSRCCCSRRRSSCWGSADEIVLLAAVAALGLGSLIWILIRDRARASRARATAAAKAARAEARARLSEASPEEAAG